MQKFIYWIQLLDADGNPYKLRQAELSAVSVRYRKAGTEDSFTEELDYNVDEKTDKLWVRLEPIGQADVVVNVTTTPLRNVTTGLVQLFLGQSTTGFEITATPTPLYSLQGFSPRIIDGYWHEFNDAMQAFVNTGIQAKGTEITEGEVVDVVEPGNPNPVSSGGVYNYSLQLISNINENTSNINRIINRLDNTPDVTVTLNGTTHTQDANGNIDLGEIDPGFDWDSFRTLDRLEEINGRLYPAGTMVENETNTVLATSDNYYYRFRPEAEGKQHFAICELREGVKIDISIKVYTNERHGTIWITKNGYDWYYRATSKDISDYIYFYRYNGVTNPIMVIATSSKYMPETVTMRSDKELSMMLSGMNTPTKPFERCEHYITTPGKDTITIDTNEFTQDPDELDVTDYVVAVNGDVSYTLTKTLDYPVSLEFAITQDETMIIVNDGTFIADSKVLNSGEIATLVYYDEENFYWTYSLQESNEIISNKVSVINNTTTNNTFYPSVKAVVDYVKKNSGPDEYVKDVTFDIHTTHYPSAQDSQWIQTYYSATILDESGNKDITNISMYAVHPDDENADAETIVNSAIHETEIPTVALMKKYVTAKTSTIDVASLTTEQKKSLMDMFKI